MENCDRREVGLICQINDDQLTRSTPFIAVARVVSEHDSLHISDHFEDEAKDERERSEDVE